MPISISKNRSEEWYAPKYIFDALECEFDIDVAAPVDISFVHTPASVFITEDSLSKEWDGFVWMNPPYINQSEKMKWMDKIKNNP